MMITRVLLVVLFLGMATTGAQTPNWAQKQLELRDLLDACVDETQKWIQNDGAIYYYLSPYKYDDEQEIFYYWPIYYLFNGDESVYETVRGITLTYLRRTENAFEHGYYPEPYFDTEHTLEGLITLASAAYLKPNDTQVIGPIEDLVEHCGNWAPGMPNWFNTNGNLLKSVNMGTQSVSTACPEGVDWPFNLGFAKLAMAAYHGTENPRYLNWVKSYLDGWTNAMELNEQQTGYYVMPAEVNPETGEAGPCSGKWYSAQFEPGWGWDQKGNNAMRDMRGAFFDYYRLTGDTNYVVPVRKHMQTLFDHKVGNTPALKFDGTQWLAGMDKTTTRTAVELCYRDANFDPDMYNTLEAWGTKHYEPDYQMWRWRELGDEVSLMNLLNEAVKDAGNDLAALQNLASLPSNPDDFPMIEDFRAISLTAFGGIAPVRGEMPWTEVMYFKQDQSLGLEPGVAALVEQGTDSLKIVRFYNTNTTDKTIYVQANYLPAVIRQTKVNGVNVGNPAAKRVPVNLPSQQLVRAEFYLSKSDTIPPLAATSPVLLNRTEHQLDFSWQAGTAAEDGDMASMFYVYRGTQLLAMQDSTRMIDDRLQPNTSYTYRIVAADAAGNLAEEVTASFTTTADTSQPTLQRFSVTNPSELRVLYTEPVDSVSALNPDNYIILPTRTISSMTLSSDKRTVTLKTESHQPNTPYTLIIKNVKDAQGNAAGRWLYAMYSFTQTLQVSNISRTGYVVDFKSQWDVLYRDREYKIASLSPELEGLMWIETLNDDKYNTSSDFLSFHLNVSAQIYVGYDKRLTTLPAWLSSWTPTSYTVVANDDAEYRMYTKTVDAGTVSFGGNHGVQSSSMYLIMIDEIGDAARPGSPQTVQVGVR